MKFRFLAIPVALGLLTLGCAGVSSPSAPSTPPAPTVTVIVLQDTVTVKTGTTYRLEGGITGTTPEQSELVWSLESGTGVLTPQGPTGQQFHCDFTAPAAVGTTVVKVSSKYYPTAYRNITITISAT